MFTERQVSYSYYKSGMSDPNKWHDRKNGNSRTVKVTFFHTGLIIVFPSNLFSKSFTDKNDGKAKYMLTQTVITVFTRLMCNK